MPSDLPLLPRFLQHAIQRWADNRQAVSQQEVEINRHNLYILPTRQGILFFVVLLLVLLGAINYENSLGFMLAFLLGSLGMLGMIYTHQNLNHLKIRIGRAEPVFAGQDIIFPVNISQSTLNSHPDINLLSSTGQNFITHLVNEISTDGKLSVTTKHRGYINPGRITVHTEYPLGLFHAWSQLKLDSRCLVYPAPDSHHYPLNIAAENNQGEISQDNRGVDDFAGIRQYQAGDLANHMAWKAIAKTGVLQTRMFNTEVSQDILISWSELDESLDTEKRLSILCRMILDASEHSLDFALKIPGIYIPPASGLQHKHRCLKTLALFGLPQ